MIVLIVGPTGAGKTKLSLELAKRFNAEIINADSMQVYKGYDIGTAKVTEEEQKQVPHHLLDIVSDEEEYSVYDYQKDARKVIEQLEKKQKNIFFVGGSGLYLRAALYDYQFQKEQKKYDFSKYTDEELYDKVMKMDPSCKIHPNNRRRLERHLVHLEENKFSKNAKPVYPFIVVGLTTDKNILYDRINKRVQEMINDGLIEEVQKLYEKNPLAKPLQTGIGYKEVLPFLRGKISKEEMIDTIQKNSRHYAKRQYTFFRHQFDVSWFSVNNDNFQETIEEIYNFLKERNN